MDKYNEFLTNDGPKYYNTYEGFSKHFLTLLKQEYDFQISINKDKGQANAYPLLQNQILLIFETTASLRRKNNHILSS